MIKKLVLTVIAGLFLFSGISFAEIKDVKLDAEDAEKVVQTAQKTDEAPAASEVTDVKAADTKIAADETTHVEKKDVAHEDSTKS